MTSMAKAQTRGDRAARDAEADENLRRGITSDSFILAQTYRLPEKPARRGARKSTNPTAPKVATREAA